MRLAIDYLHDMTIINVSIHNHGKRKSLIYYLDQEWDGKVLEITLNNLVANYVMEVLHFTC